jgi:nucleoid-associated protein YgaU/DNA-binding SARP family transcriptional activator
MIRRLADFAAALAALTTLVVLTIAVPIALTRAVGWPLPTTIPSLDTIQRSISSGIDHHVIVKTLAAIAWIAWAQIALTVAVETIALARGRAARSLLVLPGLQGGIGRLVTTAALVITSLLPTAGSIAAASAPTTAVAFDAYRTPTTLVLADTSSAPQTAPLRGATPIETSTVEVQRRDSYWAIAERVFDDGARWREIRDHNIGRTMPDGTLITSDSETLHPGWLLNLPPTINPNSTPAATPESPTVDADDATNDNNSPAAQAASDATVTVEPNDNFWGIAEQHLTDTLGRQPTNNETADYWQQLIDANRDLLVTGNPSLIYPGQQFNLPPVPDHTPPPPAAATPTEQPQPGTDTTATPPTDAPTDSAEPAEPPPPEQTSTTTPATNAPEPGLAPPTSAPGTAHPIPPAIADESKPTVVEEPSELSGDGSSILTASAGLLGVASTGLGVGIVGVMRRNRRRRNHLHPNTIPAITAEHADMQRAVVVAADHDRHSTLASAIDQLARSLPPDAATRPRVIQHGADHLDVLLTQPAAPALDGWRAEAGGTIWTRTRSTDPINADQPDEGWGSAAPLLVTLGRPDDTGDQLYIDLEADTLTSLTGDHDTALGVARSIITELAYSPLAERINLVIVGDLGTHAAARLDRVTTVDAWDDIANDLTAWAEQSHRVHTDHGWTNAFLARARHDHDALTPLVVIAATPPDDPGLTARLATLTPAAIAVVAIGRAIADSSVIDCTPDLLTITALGLTCEPQTLNPDAIEHISGLLDPTDDLPTEAVRITTATPREGREADTCDEQEPTDKQESADEDASDEPYEDPAFEVVVRLLGDIQVDGGSKPLTAKQTAVVAYIALQEHVSIDRLEDAVWSAPSTGPRRKRLLNTVSECRGVLGASNLPAASNDGRYTTATTVVTDLELFERRVNHAANQTVADAIDTLRGALDLVTGPVFTYRSADRHSFSWVDVENWVSRWEPKIAAVAQHLAQLCLDHHDPPAAIDVANHALRIVPTHTGLTETLMRAHAANADHTSIDAVYRAHTAALEQLDIDDVADTTSELYEQLHRTRADIT